MRIKLPSGKVWEGSPEELLHRLHESSEAYKAQPFMGYLEGFVERLRPVKVWIDPPDTVRASESMGDVQG